MATSDRSGFAERELNDGRRFRIVKNFYEPKALEQRLTGLGWQGSVRAAGSFFLYGCFRSSK